MQILYTSDNEAPTIMSLDQLLANFRTSGTKHYAEDIRDDLDGRGWYEGLHEDGRYVIINFSKLGLAPVRS